MCYLGRVQSTFSIELWLGTLQSLHMGRTTWENVWRQRNELQQVHYIWLISLQWPTQENEGEGAVTFLTVKLVTLPWTELYRICRNRSLLFSSDNGVHDGVLGGLFSCSGLLSAWFPRALFLLNLCWKFPLILWAGQCTTNNFFFCLSYLELFAFQNRFLECSVWHNMCVCVCAYLTQCI